MTPPATASGSEKNRLAAPSGRGGIAALVSILVDAIAHRDRWAIARRATGDLLDDLLAGAYDEMYGEQPHPTDRVSLDGAPVVMVDDGMALVIGTVNGTHLPAPVPVTALLVQSTTGRHWFVAALTHERITDPDFQRAVQYRRFDETADLDIIARHAPLDHEAAAIDWDDSSVVISRPGNPVVTVGDAIAEAQTWQRASWHWLADERQIFASIYMRGRHPELVREFPRSRENHDPT